MRWDGGYYTARTMKGLGSQRALRDCNIEEVAAQFRPNPTTGLLFSGGGNEKAAARSLVLSLFGPENYPEPIKVLSMPGIGFHFETELMRRREGVRNFAKHVGPARTEIHAVENDRAVFYQNLTTVPGIRNPRNTIIDLGRSSYAERTLRYLFIDRYVFADVDDVIASGNSYDCVWLDYFGPVSAARMQRIRAFFEERVRGTLVVTFLRARHDAATSRMLDFHGGHENWFYNEYAAADVEHYVEYFDTSPMAQFAVSHHRLARPANDQPSDPVANAIDHLTRSFAGDTGVSQ